MYFSDKEKKRFESIVKYEIITREIKDIDDVVLYDIIRDSVMKKNSENVLGIYWNVDCRPYNNNLKF